MRRRPARGKRERYARMPLKPRPFAYLLKPLLICSSCVLLSTFSHTISFFSCKRTRVRLPRTRARASANFCYTRASFALSASAGRSGVQGFWPEGVRALFALASWMKSGRRFSNFLRSRFVSYVSWQLAHPSSHLATSGSVRFFHDSTGSFSLAMLDPIEKFFFSSGCIQWNPASWPSSTLREK